MCPNFVASPMTVLRTLALKLFDLLSVMAVFAAGEFCKKLVCQLFLDFPLESQAFLTLVAWTHIMFALLGGLVLSCLWVCGGCGVCVCVLCCVWL